MSRTIIVSNRLPVKVSRGKDGALSYGQSEGGLATGLSSVVSQGDNLWIGWPGIHLESEEDTAAVVAELEKRSLRPVYLSPDEIEGFYEGFSNGTLWPAFHYFNEYAIYDQKLWESYRAVNEKFAKAVVEFLEPGDKVWVHDYQLMLVPAMIREAVPDITIGFFNHIPFPSYEVFRYIPWRRELLLGVLGADLVGFHTYDDVRHFLSSVHRLAGYPNSGGLVDTGERMVAVDAFPMGIDFEKFEKTAASEATIRREKRYRAVLRDQRIILSIDRLDYSKGIPQRLLAFEAFLDQHPEFRERASLIMVVVPSRDQVEKYKELKEEIDRIAGRINSAYRSMAWNPIQYFYRSFSFEALSTLYRMADVALVTPIRDGMNLVCKEYVASRYNHKGVLILSEMAGAAKELSESILMNPNDRQGFVDAIHKAPCMSEEEQEATMTAMQDTVRHYNVHHWVKIFMSRLDWVKERQHQLETKRLSQTQQKRVHQKFSEASKRLIFLDYDGTLTGFRSEPRKAAPDQDLLELLENLAKDEKTRVVLISGRDRKTLTGWFDTLKLDMIAEHGVWTRERGGEWECPPNLHNEWKQEIRPIMEMHVARTPGSFVEEKDYALVWHYRRVEPGLGELRAAELSSHLRYLGTGLNLQVLDGDKIVEVKNIEVNKGLAASRWLEKYPADFVLAIGDDRTDEDTFRAMPDTAITIKVGSERSLAQFSAPSSREVRALLKSLL